MLEDDIHSIPLQATKRDTVVVYLFHVQIQKDEETGLWYASHPLLKDDDDHVSGESRYEAWCSAQVYLRYLLQDDPAALERHGYQKRVVATDKPEATVVGRPINGIDGAYAPLEKAYSDQFLRDLVEQYGPYLSESTGTTEMLGAVLHAIQDAFCDTTARHTPTVERAHRGLIHALTDYAIAQGEGHPSRNPDAFLDRLLEAFICTVATAVADQVVTTNTEGETSIGGFRIPPWFVAFVHREWKRNARFRNRLLAHHFDASLPGVPHP